MDKNRRNDILSWLETKIDRLREVQDNEMQDVQEYDARNDHLSSLYYILAELKADMDERF